MKESEYLIVFSSGNLKQLKKKFLFELEGFYNGANYIFPLRKENKLKKMLTNFPNTKVLRKPLPPYHTFESLCETHNASYFTGLLFRVEMEILKLKQNSHSSKNSDQRLRNLIEEQEKLKKQIALAKKIEESVCLPTPSSHLDIQFIGQMDVNFFSNQPNEMPKLINFIDKQGMMHPFIRKGIAGMIAGLGGSGKTHLLTQLAISIAFGNPWLGIYPIENVGNVFLGLGENTEEDIHRLMNKIFNKIFTQSQTPQLPKQRFHEGCHRLAVKSFSGKNSAFLVKEQPTEFYENFLSQLKQKEPSDGWSCIILDPISRFLGHDVEISNASATTFISLLERMIGELKGKPTILFGHHMNKTAFGNVNTDQGSARGSSALTDGVRWQANLEKQKGEEKQNHVILRVVKTNFTILPPAQLLEKDVEGVLQAEKKDLKNDKSTIKNIIKTTKYFGENNTPEELLQKYGVFGIR